MILMSLAPNAVFSTPLMRKQRGVAAIEAALVSIFLMSTVIGVVEFGRAIYYFDSLTKAARSAARYVVTRDSSDASVRATAIAQARNIALCYQTTCGTGSQVNAPGLVLANVTIQTAEDSALVALANVRTSSTVPAYGTVDLITVTIGPVSASSPASASYIVPSITGFIFSSMAFPPISECCKETSYQMTTVAPISSGYRGGVLIEGCSARLTAGEPCAGAGAGT